MIRLCLGWVTKHDVPVYLGESGTADGVTHGMCHDCQIAANAQIDAEEEAERESETRQRISALVTAHIKRFEERNRWPRS